MATFSQFYPWIALECPNVPPKLMDDAVLRATREFCEDTFALEAAVTISTTAGVSSYTPTLPTDTELVTVLSAAIGSAEVTAVPPADMRRFEALGNTAPQQPMCFAVIETSPFSVDVFPSPDTAYSINTVIAIKPSVSAVSVDDLLFTRYRDSVIHNALYVLMSQIGQSWSNPDGAAYHHMQYTKATSKVRTMRYQALAQIETSVQMRPFA